MAAVLFAALSYMWLTLPDVRDLKIENPTTTAFMRMRAEQAAAEGHPLRITHRWVSYEHISPMLKRAVIVAEDAKFWQHDGVDYEETRLSLEQDWAAGEFTRGASTISQQLAKNLYLSSSKSPARKLAELMITRRLEADLSKRRIFELYLNLIEWGDGIWGAEAAARVYYGAPSSSLSADQAAMLAGSIINPRIYSPAHPNARLMRRQKIILARMGDVTPPPNGPAPTPVEATPEPALQLPVSVGLPRIIK